MIDVIEPCCYVRQIHDLLSRTQDGHACAVHYGDVHVSHFFDRFTAMCREPSEVYVVLPVIDDCTMEGLLDLLRHTHYVASKENGSMPRKTFTHINILTRKATEPLLRLKNKGRSRVRLSVDAGLGFRMLAVHSDAHHLVVTGSLIQRPKYGAQFIEFETNEERCNTIFDFLNSQMRVHRVSAWNYPTETEL